MAPAGCRVVGQPARLTQLMEGSVFFQNASVQNNSLCGLYSSALVYGETEIQEIMGTEGDNIKPALPPCWPLLSPVDGRVISASRTSEVVKQSVETMLQQPIRWNALLESAVNSASELKDFDGRLLISGSAAAANAFAITLASAVKTRTEMESLTSWCNKAIRSRLAGSDNKSKIAVVGMSLRLSPDPNAEELWEDTDEGYETDNTEKRNGVEVNPSTAKTGLRFNHGPFGFCVTDLELLDSRLAIITAYEALEMSGFVPNRTPSTQLDRVGSFYSQTSDDWQGMNTTDAKLGQGPTRPRAFTPGRVSHYFNFGGPSHSVDTACTSSLAAVHTACKSLQSRECDTAVIGGLDVSSAPTTSAGSGHGEALCRVGSSDGRPDQKWDIEGNKFGRAEGVASIVLKRFEDARADKDNIVGVILGSATNHSGDSISARHPHAGNQSSLYDTILRSAGIDSSEVSYVEKQGAETASESVYYTPPATGVINIEGQIPIDSPAQEINSTKPTMGQIEGAFGVTALTKILLRMRKQENLLETAINASLNPNRRDLPKACNSMVTRKPRLAFLTRVSVARGNTALLLQGQAESTVPLKGDSCPSHIVALSANTIASLKKNMRSMMNYIERNPNVSLSSMGYTTTARRVHHQYRQAFSVSSKEELQQQLATKLKLGGFYPALSSPPKVAFIFTGQGCFYPCLAQQLFEISTQFRTYIKYLNDLTVHQGLPSFLPAIIGSAEEGKASTPLVQQLALACVQMALAKLWRVWGIEPSMVVGQSLGEYAALNVAGVISVDHTIHLVGQRGKILQSSCEERTHGMLAVKAGLPTISAAAAQLETSFEVECLNSDSDTVIGGPKATMESMAGQLKGSGVKCMQVDLPYAFHSAQVEPVLEPYKHIADGVRYESPKVPVISSLLGRVVNKGGVFDAEYCRRHTREPVNLIGAVQAAKQEGLIDANTICVEIGPHPVCSVYVKSILGSKDMVMAPSLRKGEDPWCTLGSSLSILHCKGLGIDWREVHRDFEGSCQLVPLPASPFGIEDCKIEYPVASLARPVLNCDFGKNDNEEVGSGSLFRSSSVTSFH